MGAQSWLGPGVDPSGDLVAIQQESYRDGVLEIRLPKRPEATDRIISVETV